MFSSLRIRNFRLYMAGLTVSVAGNWMQNVAVGWLVLQLTDSGTVLGAVTAARFAPLLVLGAWGGLVADRHDKRLLLRITAVVQLVVAAVLGGLTMTHVIDIWSLTGLILVAGVVDVIDTPSRQAFMNNIVGRDRIGNAIALNSVLINGARVVGPGIAGFVIATVGVGPCFLLNAASFAATWLGLQLMRRDELIHTAAEAAAKRQIRAGLRYVLSTPDLRTPLLLVAVAGAFAWEFQVSIPLFTSDTFHGGASEFGWALSAISVGSIAGGLLAARRRLVTQRSVAMSALLWGIAILAAVPARRVPVAGDRRVRRGDVQRDVQDVPADHLAGPDAWAGDGAVVDRLAGHHRARRAGGRRARPDPGRPVRPGVRRNLLRPGRGAGAADPAAGGDREVYLV
jgi:hypothetical protein